MFQFFFRIRIDRLKNAVSSGIASLCIDMGIMTYFGKKIEPEINDKIQPTF